jgi:N-acetylmuramoyl-L-alanine amidase
MRFWALAAFGSILAAQTGNEPVASVTAVRHWSFKDSTRVAVEVSAEFQYRTDRLHNPERVYFDILNAMPRFGAKRFYIEDVSDALLKRIRVAETKPNVTRIVLDLADAVDVSPSQLTNPDRLIVELRKAPPAGPSTDASPVSTAPVLPKPEIPESAPAPKATADNSSAAKEPVEKPAVETPTAQRPPVESPVEVAAVANPGAPPAVAESAKPLPDPAAETGKAARRTSQGETSLVRALGLKVNRVVIDPGHGGHDNGTEGAKGLLEKDLVLDVSKRLGKLIENRMQAEVIYTRTDDTFIPLEGRTALANEKKADLFLSIHANSSPAVKVAGVETYYLNFTESQDALDVASRENATSQKTIFELRDIIQKITLHDKAEESREFAARVQAALFAFSLRNFPAERNRGVRKAPFVVLIGANMPSVLAEIGFLSNPREESLLKKSDYRQRLAEALFRGVQRYADSLSHFQVAQNK